MDRPDPTEQLAPNDEAAGARRRPVLPAARGLRARRARHRAALARRRTGVSGPDPAAGHRHPAAVPHHRHVRGTRGDRHHRDRARRTLPAPPVPDGLLPVRHRRGQRTLLPVVRAAPPRKGARRACPVRIPAGRRGARRGLGGVGARPRGHRRDLGRALRTRATACSTASAPPWATSALGLSPDAPVGLWGYSGGGLATAWAAEVCGDYAPELNIVGAVLGSPVGDLGHTFRRLNGTFFSGLPATVVAALVPRLPRPGPGDPASTPPTRARRCWPGSSG